MCKLLLFCVLIENDGTEKLLGDVGRYADLEKLVVPMCVWRGDNVWRRDDSVCVEGESGEGGLHKGTKTNMRVIT